jgi:formylglycine-generating enzyme required for sulfatase activity
MYGNVWEWVADVYGLYGKEPQVDPWGLPGDADAGPRRVVRGGCYSQDAGKARAACRDHWLPWIATTDLGFRAIRSAGPDV